MKRVMIHHNYSKTSLTVKDELIKLLKTNGHKVTKKNPNLIMVIGGDGTMLSAIRSYYELGIPFVGINTGTLGFLTCVAPKDLNLVMKYLKTDQCMMHSYPLLEVTSTTVSGDFVRNLAFNEILIKHLEPRLMEAKVKLNNKPFNYFTGDGFIISTPVGATGYAIWGGGVAMHSDLNVFQLTPVHPNDNRVNNPLKHSMVLPIDTVVDINIIKARHREVIVACDGKKVSNDYISELTVKVSKRSVNIMRMPEYDYYDLFRQKIIDKGINRYMRIEE